MDSAIDFIIQNAHLAHWFVFAAILLAGMNIPISIDLVVIVSAVLAANVIPEKRPQLFVSVLLGCWFSAWIAYWIGRLVGPKLTEIRWFSKLLSKKRLKKVKNFYDKYGFWSLMIGRFIPFGVRNCIFMSSGMSKMHFGKFLARDAAACLVWCSASFTAFYLLGQNYQVLYSHVKIFNILIFSAFSVTVIALIWYKKIKKARTGPS